MNIVSKDIKDMLEAESSLGLVLASNLFVGREPAKIKETVTIYDTPGFPPSLSLDTKSNYQYPSIQIRVKSTQYDFAMELATRIMDSLHGRAQETWGGTLYSSIMSTGNPALLDWDDNGNCRIIINFNIQRR